MRWIFSKRPGPYYHDFSRLGLPCRQLPGIFAPNQKAKEPILTSYIVSAIRKLRSRGIAPVQFAELFCADAYYAMFARKFGADSACGFDSDREGYLSQGEQVKALLGLTDVALHRMEVSDIPTSWRYSIVANVGGLYHVSDPVSILRRSAAMAEHFLIVQCVVSVANDDPDYFESPAPGWTWGSRFSRRSFERMIRAEGYRVIDTHFNTLSGNERPEDQGSIYYLIETGP
jgi:hypothetical protein